MARIAESASILLMKNRMFASEADESSESALQRILRRIRRTREFPAISKYVIEINQKLAANPESSSASDLADVILKDYGLTNKLLKLVNSAFYSRAAGTVSTITRAVIVLGYENVRLASLSLTLFEHFKGKSANTPDLGETLISSFWAGVLARDIANRMGSIDPEEAFICAMMSQLGKLLMITFLPRVYKAICDSMASNNESESRAARRVCGVTYEELGMAMAEQWNFPSQIRTSMQPLTNKQLDNKRKPPYPLEAICSFVKELSGIIAKDQTGTNGPPMRNLLQRYKPILGISNVGLKELIWNSLDKLQQHARVLNIAIDRSNFLTQLSMAYQPSKTTQPPITADLETDLADGAIRLNPDIATGTPNETIVVQHAEKIITAGIEEISQVMTSAQDMNEVASMSLEVLYRALGFQRSLMFIFDVASRSMVVQFGYGRDSRRLIGDIRFRVDSRKDLFNLAISTGKDLIMDDARDPRNRNLIPQWYRARIDAPAFIFLPVKIRDACIGAFYADRSSDGRPITEIEHQHLSNLRDQLVLAIAHQQRTR